MVDADIHPDDAVVTIGGRDMALDLDGKRDEPAVGGAGEGGGKNAAVPCSRRRASLRVDSWVLSAPIRGRVTCLRSAATRSGPVVNRQASRQRPFFFLVGKPTGRPLRRPDLQSEKF